jgi:hypothetical protein
LAKSLSGVAIVRFGAGFARAAGLALDALALLLCAVLAGGAALAGPAGVDRANTMSHHPRMTAACQIPAVMGKRFDAEPVENEE